MKTRIPSFPSLLLSFSVLASSVGCGGGEAPADGNDWNVLLVTLDTTRADRLSCYGYEVQTTPHLDRLAEDGVLFERAISTAGITPMSHSSILTGLNNYSHGMRVFYSDEVSHKLKDSVDTLPEILARRGYKTAACVSSYPVSEEYGLNQGFEHFTTGIDVEALDLKTQQKHAEFWVEGGSLNTQRRGDLTVNDAISWLDKEGEKGPWCMWVHLFDVHDYSLVPPLEYAKEFGINAYPRGEVDGKSVEWREKMYDPEMRFQDAQVGRIFQWLRDKGLYDNTIVVVTADHGQGLKDGMQRHGWAKHRLLYDWSLHVPMIVKVPGMKPDQRVKNQVRTIDIVPTVLEALNVPAKKPVEGESMLPLIRGEVETEARLAYAEALNMYDDHAPRRGMPEHSRNENLYMVSDGDWKMIFHREREEHELFDLRNDPLELKNVASDKPEVIARLKTFLDERNAWRIEKPGDDGGDGPSEAALKGLGYGDDSDDDSDEEADED